MKLKLVVERYLEYRQCLGARVEYERVRMRSFCRAMGNIDIKRIHPDRVAAFLRCDGRMTSGSYCKFTALNVFYRFAIGRGYVSCSPLPTIKPKLLPPGPPHIYTTRELRRLLDATPCLAGRHTPFRGRMFRILLLTLYGSGLRIGEALNLTLADVDVDKRLLVVRDGKFHKSRLVPIGPRLADVLKSYIQQRRGRCRAKGGDLALFPSSQGTAMSRTHAGALFQRLRQRANIRHVPGACHQPRLHDIRHTAAVHRLVAWYRRGEDVQRLLPKLSVYLGHTHLSGTQHYLKMTPELLRQANRRFERYALLEASHD